MQTITCLWKALDREVILGLENYLMPCVMPCVDATEREKMEQMQRWAKMENHEVPEKKK